MNLTCVVLEKSSALRKAHDTRSNRTLSYGDRKKREHQSVRASEPQVCKRLRNSTIESSGPGGVARRFGRLPRRPTPQNSLIRRDSYPHPPPFFACIMHRNSSRRRTRAEKNIADRTRILMEKFFFRKAFFFLTPPRRREIRFLSFAGDYSFGAAVG